MRRPRARMHLVVAACLLLFAPALAPADDALPPAIAWRQNAFSIPFKVAPATGADQQPSEIRLYVSTNQGAKWDLAQTVPPTATSFTYRAQADGEYWFLIRSVDRKGQLQPELGDHARAARNGRYRGPAIGSHNHSRRGRRNSRHLAGRRSAAQSPTV